MLLKKYLFIIILLSIGGVALISEFFIFNFLSSNLKKAEKSVPVEIRLPIINLAAYDTLNKKGETTEEKKLNNFENNAIDFQPAPDEESE